MEKLDLTDKKILYELDVNCNQSNSQIAKKLKVSKDIVNYRIKKLEEKGIIEGYRTIIDLSKLGYLTFRAYLKFQDTSKEIELDLINFLKEQKEVWWIGKLAGRVDFVFTFWTKSRKMFYEFWIEFLKKFRKYIQHEQISTFIEYIHYRRAYILDLNQDSTKPEIIGSEPKIKHDNTDLEILSIIAKNARTLLLEIARKTKLTPMAVKYRRKNLEKKGVIQGYRALINFSKLGYEYYKVDMYLEDVTKIKQIEFFCHAHPNIVYLDRTIGGGDIEFDLEVKNLEHFMQIIEQIKEKFRDAIRNFEYFSVLKIYKTLYFPVN